MAGENRIPPPEAWTAIARHDFLPRTFPCRSCGHEANFGFCVAMGALGNVGSPVFDVEFLCHDCSGDRRTPLLSAKNIPVHFEVTAVLGPSYLRVVRRTRPQAEDFLVVNS